MEVRELQQYRSLRKEIEDTRRKIKQYEQSDKVRGSDPFFPYLNHPMQVAGAEWTARELIRLRLLLRECRRQYEAISAYIDSIEDSETRRIFRLRYIDGDVKPSWQMIAFKIGEHDEQYPRRKHNRYLNLTKMTKKKC